MARGKIIKILLKKFKWNFIFLFFFSFLVTYLTFLTTFNFRNNLTYDQKIRGWFYFLFGKFSVIKKRGNNNEIYVDWNKLLLILFLLYFPFKIIIQSTLNYFQKFCERKVIVYLTKKMLNFACKHEDFISKEREKKIYVITNSIPEFSRQFFDIPVKLFSIFADISFALFWFFFLISSRELFFLLPYTFIFTFVNLFWLVIFKLSTKKFDRDQKKKKSDYQNSEKDQIKIFIGNLSDKNKSANLHQLRKSLDRNSQKITSLNFNSLFLNLPNLIISGFSLLFLYLYYNLFLGGEGGLTWGEYFVALDIQSIFSAVKRMFNLLPTISDFQENCQKIERFFN